MNDPIGCAIKDYHDKKQAPEILIHTNYTEEESIQPSYFFRTFEEMPSIEQSALQLCSGKVLDVGAGAGSHSLYLQQNGFEVTALEQSGFAAEVCKMRNIKQVVQSDLYNLHHEKFDTILVLMNGTGIGGTLSGLEMMLSHLKKLLNKKGQILIDSSDIKYLFEEEDGSYWVDLNSSRYYGEMQYEVHYKKHHLSFDWLFVDFMMLKKIAKSSGLDCEMVKEGDHFDYLARLTFH